MKKLISILLLAAMLLGLCACAENVTIDNPSTEPEAPQTEPTAPDPTEPEPTEPEPTWPSGDPDCKHTFDEQALPPANCTQPSSLFTVCTLCGAEFSITLAPAGHLFSEATCTEAKTCQRCGAVEGEALGHAFTSGICDRCGEKMPDCEEVPSACDHLYALTEQTAPTCTENGKQIYSCVTCGNVYTEVIDAKGHIFSPATCHSPKTCLVCDTASGDPLGHHYIDGTCSRCGASDPSAPQKIPYKVTIRSDKGKTIAGVTVKVFTNGNTLAASGKTNADGTVSMTLFAADSYKIVLSDIPQGLSAKESYTFRSTSVNINLSTVPTVLPDDHSKANYRVGSLMGDFTLTDTDGITYTLSNLLKEKDLVILNFWFVNCAPCRAEFPYFEAVAEKYSNVQLLTLNHIDTEANIITLRQQLGVSFPMIAENIGMREGFGMSTYPTTVFIDSSGRILRIERSAYSSQSEFEAIIDSYLN